MKGGGVMLVSVEQRVANEHSLSQLLALTSQRGRQCGWPWQTVLRPPKPSSQIKSPTKGFLSPAGSGSASGSGRAP